MSQRSIFLASLFSCVGKTGLSADAIRTCFKEGIIIYHLSKASPILINRFEGNKEPTVCGMLRTQRNKLLLSIMIIMINSLLKKYKHKTYRYFQNRVISYKCNKHLKEEICLICGIIGAQKEECH